MTVDAPTKRAPGRPKTDPDTAERQELVRIAELGFNILSTLRQSELGKYDSERMLQLLLKDNGVAFTASDMPHALNLVEGLSKLVRPPVGPKAHVQGGRR